MSFSNHTLSQFLSDLYELRDRRSFTGHVLSALHQVVPCDYLSYNEIAAARPSLIKVIHRPYNVQAAKLLPVFDAHAGQHPILSHWRQSGVPGRTFTWTDFLSLREFQQCALYQDYFRPLGILRQVAFSLSLSPSRIICVGLNRSGKDFSPQEKQDIELLRPHLARAFAHVRAFSRLHAVLRGRNRIDAQLHHGAIGLTSTNRIAWVSATAGLFLEDYFPNGRQRESLPGPLAQWLAGTDGRRHGPTHETLASNAFTIQGPNGSLTMRLLQDGRQRYLLLNERRVPSGNKAFLAYGLTDREIEVLRWVARGKSNADIAAILGVSQRTVAKHLERTFQALGVENRTAAAAKIHQVMRRHSDLR